VKKKFKLTNYNKNIIMNYIFKLIAILVGLLNVNINLSYLGDNLYGLWVTIASIISWMNYGDFGVSNGLRNELSKAIAERNNLRQRELISTAVICLSKISFILLLTIIIICETFFRLNIMESLLRIPMYITAVFFCINLVLGISRSIAYSYQKSWLASMTQCNTTLLSVLIVKILLILKIPSNLTLFSIIHGIAVLLPNLILILLLKHNKIKIFSKTIKRDYKKNLKKSIMNIGIIFFLIQLCCVVLNSTDNLLINYLMDETMVTKYSIITKVYNTGNDLFSILLISFWSAVTYNTAKGNYRWILKKIKSLIFIWFIFSIGVVFVSMFFNKIVYIWLQENAIFFETSLIVLFGIYCSTTAFAAIFIYTINGMGTIKLQLILVIIEAIINIPLSIFLARDCEMGIFGIKLSTFICNSISAIILPIETIIIICSRNLKSTKALEDMDE